MGGPAGGEGRAVRRTAHPAPRASASRWGAIAAGLGGLLLVVGCAEERQTRLVPLWGCALEGEELTSLRVRARGDLPAAEAAQLLLDEGSAALDDLPSGVDAVTVEGLFGETVVLAVGRTARLPQRGTLPVYFAPPDQLCPVESDLEPRDRVAIAVDGAGDVLAVGGRGPSNTLLDEIVLLHDVDDRVRVANRLPEPAVGQTITATGERSFLLVGGATDDDTIGKVWRIDVESEGESVVVRDGVPVEIGGAVEPGRAFHGAVSLPDGRMLVIGGCSGVEGGACLEENDAVLRSGFFITDPSNTEDPGFERAPPMLAARYDFDLHVSRDGVVFAVGGSDDLGQGVRDIEMLLPGASGWAPYGPALFEALGVEEVEEVVGSALLEGGLVVFALSGGSVWRVDQNHLERLPSWCSGEDAPCFLARVDVFSRRSLLALEGERVLADRFVLPVGVLGRDGRQAVDLSAPKPGETFQPPAPRAGAAMVTLADGTVLAVGGRVPASGALALPVVTRFRPVLDGPDEGTPDVSNLDGGAVVLHDSSEAPARISSATQTLVLEPDPLRSTDFAVTWVHFRGFRSRRFVLEGAVEALNGSPTLRFVFSRGAIARTELAIGSDGVQLAVRDPDGSAVAIVCSDQGVDFSGVGRSVRVDVSPSSIDVSVDNEEFARCPWAGDEAVAVGLGAIGAGTIRTTGMRLSRN